LAGRDLGTVESYVVDAMQKTNGDRDSAIQELRRTAQSFYDKVDNKFPNLSAGWKFHGDDYARAAQMLEEGYEPPKGSLYQVAIKSNPEHFLDYDLSLKDQPVEMQKKLRQAGVTVKPQFGGNYSVDSMLADLRRDLSSGPGDKNGAKAVADKL